MLEKVTRAAQKDEEPEEEINAATTDIRNNIKRLRQKRWILAELMSRQDSRQPTA